VKAVTTLLRSSDPALVSAVKEVIHSVGGLTLEMASREDLQSRLGQDPLALVLFHRTGSRDGADAAALIREMERFRIQVPILILSDTDDPEQELALLRLGAADFLTRPLNLGRLAYLVEKHTLKARLGRQPEPAAQRAIEALGEQDPFLFDSGAATGHLMAQVRRLAPQDTTVLLGGETGTGKTRLARLIHELSPRNKEPFLTINCGCLSESLIASEMFGHVRGAFTGADRDRTGKFTEVGTGTLLLDDIDALPLALQAQLLRVVEERVFEPVGSNQTQQLRARLVVASNRSLAEEVKAGRFRTDLFYRLNVIGLSLPPLRECRQIIPHVARKFIAHFAAANGHSIRNLSADALRALQAHNWPGNVRELRNVIERTVALCPGDSIELDDLPDAIRSAAADIVPPEAAGAATAPLARSKWDAEAVCIMEALERHNQSRSRAAAALGISRMTLYRKLHRYGLLSNAPEPTVIVTQPRPAPESEKDLSAIGLFREAVRRTRTPV
jgi:two-component system, NtrC family, response regulator HydG